MKKKFNDSLKSKYVLVILSVFCAVMIVLSFFVDVTETPFRYAAGYVLTPIQNGMNSVGRWIADRGVYFQSSAGTIEENRQLQSEVDQLTDQNTQLLQEKEELDRLRELYELDKQYEDYEKVGARIIFKDPGNWFNVFTINKGSDDGIQVNNNVIAGSGLVGIVTEVGPKWATVRAIIDDYSNVSATVSSTSDSCIIAGDLRLIDEGKINLIQLTDVEDQVTVGDKVITSDVSDRFLPGILIGYIAEIGMDSNNLTKSGTITPVVDFRHLHEVLVILELKELDDARRSLDSQSESETEAVVDTEGRGGASTETNSESGDTEETPEAAPE